MAHKKWIVADADKEKASAISEKYGIDPFVAFILVSRGIDDDAEVSQFLSDSIYFSSPFGMKDMDKAVECIKTSIENCEKICIYGDYDCDGVTSTALLMSFFESLGADVFYYIPKRDDEGYGMHISAIDEIKEKGAKLIVTVDNGVSAFEEAEYIYECGLKLVITDHHKMSDKLPKAEAVVNPHRTENDIPFDDLSGVGVAFKLAAAVFGSSEEIFEQYADLAALGTIADMVELKSENRSLVKAGLSLINHGSRVGIEALKRAAGVTNNLTSTDVAFKLSPRINAVGRLSCAAVAVELLLTDDEEEAINKANQLSEENAHRQELERKILSEIHLKISENPELVSGRVIVIGGNGYHIGVIGIVASHLVEEYDKPAIVLTVGDDGNAAGSCRSIDGFDIYEALTACKDILARFGGHPMAAGLGLKSDDINTFRNKINDFAVERYEHMPHGKIVIDCKIQPNYLDLDLVNELAKLEPCGAENKNAVFGLYNMKLLSVTPMGEGRHIRFETEKKGKKLRIVKFRTTLEDFSFKTGDMIDCAVTVSENVYQGKSYLSVMAVDVRAHGINDDKYFEEIDDYDIIKKSGCGKLPFYPSREVCSIIYKFLKYKGGYTAGMTELYFALQKYDITYSQLSFAIDAFAEAGLIKVDGKKINLCDVTGKVDLESTTVISSLKGE